MRNIVLLGAAVCLGLIVTGLLVVHGAVDPQTAQIAEWVKQLGDDSFVARETATKALRELGEKAVPAVADVAADTEDLEVRRRAMSILLAVLQPTKRSESIGCSLLRVMPGSFSMGSPPSEPGRQADEGAHRVRITRPFYLGANEVTQDEYDRVMKNNPSHFSLKGLGSDKVKHLKTTRYPVESVTWFDAVEFCNRLSALDGFPPFYRLSAVVRTGNNITSATVQILGRNGYRLPTEAEWEYACRGDTLSTFHFGPSARSGVFNVKPIMVVIAYGMEPAWPDLGRTAEVGSYRPNGWGFYDMHGNVAEWCGDWYDANHYAVSSSRDPLGPDKGERRVVRGGSWLTTAPAARSAARTSQRPGDRHYTIGFRVARQP